MRTAQKHGDIGIAVRVVRAPRPTAVDDRAHHLVATGYQGEEAADRFLCILIKAFRHYHTLPCRYFINIVSYTETACILYSGLDPTGDRVRADRAVFGRVAFWGLEGAGCANGSPGTPLWSASKAWGRARSEQT